MLQRATKIAVALCLFGPCAGAETLPLGCYTNTYDKAHLDKHKGQTITSITMKMIDVRKMENAGAVMWAEFEVTLRGKGKAKWGETGLCNGKPGAWKCQIECDGGNFGLAEDANGLTVINTDGFRISRDGGCGEDTDAIEAKPGNRRFRLSKAKLSACK